jgi:peptidyl-prolyl cis-trans isomerase A (cyclophilin A)
MRKLILILSAAVLAGCGGGGEKPAEAPRKAARREGPMPDVYKVRFETSKGAFIVEVHKEWAPKGAERFWKLLNMRFFDDTRFFRVRPDFIVQFGLSGDPQTNSLLNAMPIQDDPVKQKNARGMISFAQAGKNTRRTQVFINLKDNRSLDRDGFAPFGKVVEGLEVLEKLYAGYGEWSPPGSGPSAAKIQMEGNSYLDSRYPRLDRLKKAVILD